MQPYIIKQGDYLAKLAYKYGFDADTVWKDEQNAALRQLRPDPNILWPTDVLYIPKPAAPTAHDLNTGTTNSFVSTTPTVTLTIQFTDTSLASQAFSVPELPNLTGKTTEADGTASVDVPVNLESFTIAFTQTGMTFAFTTGGLDPINTASGVFQRLQNLGYISREVSFYPLDLDRIRAALRALKASQPAAGASAPAPSGASDPSAATGPPDPAADPGAQSSGATSSSDAWAIPYNAGLNDDGVLNSDTAKLLATAHGS